MSSLRCLSQHRAIGSVGVGPRGADARDGAQPSLDLLGSPALRDANVRGMPVAIAERFVFYYSE